MEKDDFEIAKERKNFVRAAHIASSLGLPKDQVKDLQLEALWQMAAINRNAAGTRSLAEEYGLSKQELKKLLQERANKAAAGGEVKILATTLDMATGRYFSFAEWLEFYMGKWKDYR